MAEELLPFCECGECGLRVTKKGNRFRHGHNNRGITRTPEHCAAISAAKLGVPLSPEHRDAISIGKLGKPHTSPAQIAADKAHGKRMEGIPHTPEHNAAVSAATLGIPKPHTSPAQIAADEIKRGGNDLVTHHYIYDESDLSLNTVKMTRSDHMRLHRLLQKLNYIVPHIKDKGQ